MVSIAPPKVVPVEAAESRFAVVVVVFGGTAIAFFLPRTGHEQDERSERRGQGAPNGTFPAVSRAIPGMSRAFPETSGAFPVTSIERGTAGGVGRGSDHNLVRS